MAAFARVGWSPRLIKSQGCVQRVKKETKTKTFLIKKKKKALTECVLWDLTPATASVCFSLEGRLERGQDLFTCSMTKKRVTCFLTEQEKKYKAHYFSNEMWLPQS